MIKDKTVQIIGSAGNKEGKAEKNYQSGIILADKESFFSAHDIPADHTDGYQTLVLCNRLSILQSDCLLREIEYGYIDRPNVSKQKNAAEVDWMQLIRRCALKIFNRFSISEIPQIRIVDCDLKNRFIGHPLNKNVTDIMKITEGRLLLESELAEAVKQNISGLPVSVSLKDDKRQTAEKTQYGISETEQNEAIRELLFREEISVLPAISWDETAQKMICIRCGSSEYIREIECLHHTGRCWMCENCLNMGQAKGCVPMYYRSGRKHDGIRRKEVELFWKFDLTDAQKDAAGQLMDFWQKPVRECLVWAVCGAGKTELTFPVISEALESGGKVLFAIPRKDVVIDLLPRIQQAFPSEKIKALYGGSGEKFLDADIILATTHQVMRFYQAFDLIILDESDAFPYADSDMLHLAVRRAMIPQGKIIFMSATPDNELQQRSLTGKIFLVTIPVRHHGHPLPLPQFIKCGDPGGNKLRDKRSINIITELIRKSLSDEGRQIFVFVPTIRLAEETGNILSRILKGETTVDYSHSRDARRTEKLNDFRAGNIRVLVTTAIMERGVTVPKADVLILYADRENIYDGAALVQMSGRAGRSREFPEGAVWFAAERKSAAMNGAIELIKRMNLEALNKGYLKHV